MNNQTLWRGLFFMAIALIFGATSLSYKVGHFSNSGPGLFPLLVSSLLFLIGLITALRSRTGEPVPLEFNTRNIVIILVSLGGFALLSEYLNMIVGIVFMVFCSTLAGTSYSVKRNVKISLGLVAVAFAFQKLLGLNLPLV